MPSDLPAQYSFSLTTFSPSGKLAQIEYALNAVNSGATSLGIRATNGVVIATEKKLPSILIDDSTVQKISELTPNVGVVYRWARAGLCSQPLCCLASDLPLIRSGMGPDSRVLVRKARKSAESYFRVYQDHIPVAQLVREVATVMQEFTRGSRTAPGDHRRGPVCPCAISSPLMQSPAV